VTETSTRRRRASVVVALSPETRAQLIEYLSICANERALCIVPPDLAGESPELAAALNLAHERALVDVEHARNEQLPITPAKLRHFIRAIGNTPRIALTAEQKAAVPAFLERLQASLRQATVEG
jgi:hypothetical protein